MSAIFCGFPPLAKERPKFCTNFFFYNNDLKKKLIFDYYVVQKRGKTKIVKQHKEDINRPIIIFAEDPNYVHETFFLNMNARVYIPTKATPEQGFIRSLIHPLETFGLIPQILITTIKESTEIGNKYIF